MGRYTDFTLCWEQWGGYPHRQDPFGLPQLAWFIASADNAARCLMTSQPKGPTGITWSAAWQHLPHELLDPVPGLLEEASAFDEPTPLVEDTAAGDYLIVWELTGALRDVTYREQQRAAQYAALDATAVDIDEEEDLDAMLEQLREARHAVAKRRRRG